MNTVPLGSLISPATSVRAGEDAYPVLSITRNEGLVFQQERFKKPIASKNLKDYKIVNRGQLVVGFPIDEAVLDFQEITDVGIVSPAYGVWDVSNFQAVDINYLSKYLRSPQAIRYYKLRLRGTTARRRSLTRDAFESLPVPLPPIAEQQRIAEILDVSKRQSDLLMARKIQLSDLRVGLVDQVLEVDDRMTVPLKEIAEIQSGITKGRKVREGETLTESAYMAVSNVKDGYLDLKTVKTIPVTEAEITRYRLQAGDVLLTEGGDPDKLGRGTVWRGEIEACLHQNHIFRVRLPEDSKFTPEVLMSMLSTKQARAYFFRSAKQTTGIASINKTQLSSVPVPILADHEIYKLSEALNQIDALNDNLEKQRVAFESLHSSLSTRAFAGQI